MGKTSVHVDNIWVEKNLSRANDPNFWVEQMSRVTKFTSGEIDGD